MKNLDATAVTQINRRNRTLKEKLLTLPHAVNLIKSDDQVVTSMAAAEPRGFFDVIAKRAAQLDGVRVACANVMHDYDCFRPELRGHIDFELMFLSPAMRSRHVSGNISYLPGHLSQWVENILSRSHVNVFWGVCSMPDERGFVSLGTGAVYEPELLKAADLVILEINKNLPTSYGATIFHSDHIDYFVRNDCPLHTLGQGPISSVDHAVGEVVANFVSDGCTLQLGIGGIPNAIADALGKKTDLGIHTEMINDCIMKLAKAGVVTGQRKSLWPGKIIGSFAFGSEELYRFIDRNPSVELQPASLVNDPKVIAQNHKMISINTAVEVDITGQVCSESVGHFELSGVGGAADTHVGAQRSLGGRGIIALHSRTLDGKKSKICFELNPGAKVSISRNDVDTIVTEYGYAELRHRTISERVQAMIKISHPDFREQLTMQAKEVGYIH